MYSIHMFADIFFVNPPKLLVYSPDSVDDGYVVNSCKFTNEAGKAGEATFVIPVSHPYYNEFRKIRTMIMIFRDDKLVWFGRVFSIKRDFYYNKTIVCEGALSFLEDICLMPYRYLVNQNGEPLDPTDPSTSEYFVNEPVTKWEHLNNIFELYNLRCHSFRRIGITTNVMSELHTYKNVYGCDSYNSILNEIQNVVVEDYDYSLITSFRYDSENNKVITTLNIARLPVSQCGQVIEFGKNLIDFEEFVSAEQLYTSIIPVGAGNMSIFNDNGTDIDSPIPITSRSYFVQGGDSYCGAIDKVINFNNITDRDELIESAEKVFDFGGGSPPVEFTINAVDLNILDVNTDALEVGEQVRVISAPHNIDTNVICCKTEIDILNPALSRYSFSNNCGMSPETITEHLRNEFLIYSKELDQKLNAGQTYGVFKMSANQSSLSLLMPKS